MRRFAVVFAVFGWLACGERGGGTPDVAPDASPDLSADSGWEGAPDAAPDPGGEAFADVVPDPAADFAPDAEVADPGIDAAGDPGGDADVPSPHRCCIHDFECGKGSRCVAIPGAMGTCEPVPDAGKCWSGKDCAQDEVCIGAHPCPCDAAAGDDCDIPGQCVAQRQGCCQTDFDCPAKHVCGAWGTCQPEPAPGKCWADAHCAHGQTCEGSTECPCGAVCGIASFPGNCSPLPTGCCNDDAGCADGQVCRGFGGLNHLPGRCVPSPAGPECLGDAACCWNDADCPGGWCKDAIDCGCETLCPWCCSGSKMGFCASYGIQVQVAIGAAHCEVDGPWSRLVVKLAWDTSIPAKSRIEYALNEFLPGGGYVPIDEGFVTDHAFDLGLGSMGFWRAPKAGDEILIRIRVEGQGGQVGLSEPAIVPVTEEDADCLFGFDEQCSDGFPPLCRAAPGDCDAGLVMATIEGCVSCVYPATCSCDDGSPAVCAEEPPECEPYRVLAVQGGCFACVSRMTCRPKV